MSLHKLLVAALALSTLADCRESPWLKLPNKLPIAKALVVDPQGQSVTATTFPFDGTPVEVTLDGTQSSDEDGTVNLKYRWLSSTVAAPASMGAAGAGGAGGSDAGMGAAGAAGSDAGMGAAGAGGSDAGMGAAGTGAAGMGAAGMGAAGKGAARVVPVGEALDWPADVAQPKVTLTQGVWMFSLWVVDDKGATSDPASVTVRIGVDPVKQCINNADQTVAEACRTCACGVSDACRTAVVACDATCWALINCVSKMCPDFAAMAAKSDFSCVTGMCAASLGGATLSMPVTPCLQKCPNDCKAM